MQRHWVRTRATITSVFAAILIASFGFAAEVLGQSSNVVARGRIEGAAPPLSIGVAAAGTISDIFVQMGSRVRAGQTLVKLDCSPLEADLRSREAHLRAAQATFDRFRNGSRPDEIVVGEAVVGYSQARADEAQKTLDRTEALQEGITVTTARVLEVKRDARIADAQLAEARARLSLLRAGAREEDVRQAQALRDAASADLEGTRARLDQCSARAPADGVVVDVLASPGQYVSQAVPQPLLHIVQDGPARVRADVELRDAAHVCLQQTASVSSDSSANSFHAQVASISPMARPRSIAAASAESRDTDVVPVLLNLERDAPVLPIGSVVTVHFDACPSKT